MTAGKRARKSTGRAPAKKTAARGAAKKSPAKKATAKKQSQPASTRKKAAAKKPSSQPAKRAASKPSTAKKAPSKKSTSAGPAKKITSRQSAKARPAAAKATPARARKQAPKAKVSEKRISPNWSEAKKADRKPRRAAPTFPSAPPLSIMRKDAWASFWVSVGKVKGAAGYEIEVSEDSSFTAPIRRTVTEPGREIWFSGLQDGRGYYVRARAIKHTSDGRWSRTGTKATKHYGFTEPPSEVEAVSRDKAIEVTWKAAVTRAEADPTYQVVVATDRAMTEVIEELTVAGTPDDEGRCRAVFETPDEGVVYYFRVIAINGSSTRADNTRHDSRTSAVHLAPGASRSMTVSDVSARGFTVSWPKRDPNRRQLVEVADADDFVDALPYFGYKGQRHVIVSDLSPNKTYFVRGVDEKGRAGPGIEVRTRREARKLRIGTYNVRYIDLDGVRSDHAWSKRRESVADVLASGLDLIAVQEAASWSNSRTYRDKTQIVDLAHLVGKRDDLELMDSHGAKNPGVHIFFRPGLIEPTGDVRHIRFMEGETRRGQAIVAGFRDAQKDSEFVFVSVHFSPFVTHELRIEHARELSDAIRTVSLAVSGSETGVPAIVAGDFNSHDHRTEQSPAVILGDPKISGLNLVDAEDFDAGREKSMVHSSNTKWLTKVTTTSGHKIDQVLVDPRIAVTRWEFIETWTPTGRIRKPIASDHHAIRCSIVLPRTG